MKIKITNFPTVWFTYKSKFNIFGCDGKGKVSRNIGKTLQFQNLVPAGVGKLACIKTTMGHRQYLNILRDNLGLTVGKLHFTTRNVPKPTAIRVLDWGSFTKKFYCIN